ncbi:MAG: hypothetical protein ACXV7I_10170, partial [Ilumatobacteraceae bacterium]
MKSGRHTARLLAVAALVLTAGFVIVPGGALASAAPPTPLASGGEYHPLTPARIFDSRPATTINDVAPLGAKPLGAPDPAVFDIQLLGKGGVPDDVPAGTP